MINSTLPDKLEGASASEFSPNGNENLFDSLPIGAYRTSPEGRVLMANRVLLRMLGCSSFDELAAYDLSDAGFGPSYDRADFLELLEREGEVRGLESSWTRRDLSSFFARENARVVRDERGRPVYYEGTIEEIPDRRRVQTERQVIAEIIQGVITTANLDELFALIHRAISRVLYAENFFVALYDEATGLMNFEFFIDEHDTAPEPRRPGRGLTGHVLSTGRPMLLTDEMQRRMSERGEVEVMGTFSAAWLGVPLKTPSRTIGVLVVQHYEDRDTYSERDLEFMTSVGGQIALAIERKRSEEALRESEREYRLLFNQIVDPIFVVDKETHRFVDCNRAVVNLYGYSLEELRTMTPFNLHPPEDTETLREQIDVKHDDEPLVMTHLTKFGRRMAVEIRSDEIKFQGRPAWISIVRDVTERKRAEEELRLFATKLEHSNRELQDFASVASHDLQEPLRKIQAFGDRLKIKCGDVLSDAGRDYLERMQNAAHRMQVLINDLLTFSRVTTKAQPFVAVDLDEVVRGVVSDLEVRIEQTGGRVEVGRLMTIDADPLQMRQLFQNLIGNALKFRRPEEAPVVRVSCEKVERGEEEAPVAASRGGRELCRITVEDNGIGFDEKYLDRIFTVFQRLHGRQEYEGTGVGLAVCRRIAERHGGDITAKSAPGQGATFIVTLPLEQPKEGDFS